MDKGLSPLTFLWPLSLLVWALSGLSLSSYAASSTSSGIPVSADNMVRDLNKKQIVLSGNVQVTFKGQHLSCDKATLFLEESRVIAQGNVIMESPTVHAEGSRIEYNYETNTGFIYDGFIQSGQVIFEGRLIEKIGENEYIATEGRYTACETCPPGWSFSGKRIRAEIGGYARISRPILRFGNIPVLILPGIIVPLKSQRQSGVLTPSLTFSERGGTAIEQEFFWAIDRSQDITFGITRYEELGYKSDLEYRYVFTPESRGTLRAAHIRDKAIAKEENINKEFDRWYIAYNHLYQLPENYTHRLTVNNASDLRYPRDFSDDLPFHGDPALESKTSLTKNTKKQHLSVEATLYTNLLQSNPRADNDDAVHRFPEIRYNLAETRILDTNLMLKTRINYVNFTRSGYSYDNIARTDDITDPCYPYCVSRNQDGIFNVNGDFLYQDETYEERDIIRTGQRLDIEPTLSYPFSIGNIFSVTPEVTYRDTQYYFNLDSPVEQNVADDFHENYGDFAARRYLQTDISARTRFGRVFSLGDDESSTRIKHEIEPQVTYSRIPWFRRPEHDFFGDFEGQPYYQSTEPIVTRDVLGTNRMQFDYADRVFDKNLINFQLTNRLVRKRWLNGTPNYQTIATFRLSQAYDFNEAKDSTPQPWSAIYGLLDMSLDHFDTYTVATYYPYAKVNNVSSRVRVKNSENDYVQMSYFKAIPVNSENEVDPERETETAGFGWGFTTTYLDLSALVDYSVNESQVQGWKGEAIFKPPGNCWSFQLQTNQPFEGEATYKVNFNFNYGGT